jgi:predicted ribonuclease toxin of YeeF-YezG toxin-antitoxin module
MGIENKEVKYAKEIGEVCSLTTEIVATIKKKGDYMSLMPKLVAAVDGVADVDDEFKADRKTALATVGYHSGELVDALLPVAE